MPRGSMLKYFRDRGGTGSSHGGQLIWPGTVDGYPVRSEGTALPDLRQSEYENIPLALDFHSDDFDLWLPERKALFDVIMDRIVNGWYMQHKRFDYERPEGLRIHLEWVQIYGEVAAGKNPGAPPSGHTFTVERGQPAPPAPARRPYVSDEQLGWPDESWRPPAHVGNADGAETGTA